MTPKQSSRKPSCPTNAVIFTTFLLINNYVIRYLVSIRKKKIKIKKGVGGLKEQNEVAAKGNVVPDSEPCSCASASGSSSPRSALPWDLDVQLPPAAIPFSDSFTVTLWHG